MGGPLNIAFVWHMHQPLYRDPFTGIYDLPWVLLHATKDYIDMVTILDEFPDIHQTFNLVPSLMEQLRDYSSDGVADLYREISKKPPKELSEEEKVFMLKNFFSASREHMIWPLAGYGRLLRKLGTNSGENLSGAVGFFTERDYRDLQVYFNLVWIDPVLIRADPFLKALYEKGGHYTEEEKHGLLARQIKLAAGVLPLYKEYQERGLIEVSTTPYYHPIMPILYNSDSAREAVHDIGLPATHMSYPEDVKAQLKKAVTMYEDVFGRAPRGLWPSEGSVSMDIVPLITEAGFNWAATDEEILTNSLKRPFRRNEHGHAVDNFLYSPWKVNSAGSELSFIFRDHVLSDLIGFDYSKSDAHGAANDFITRLGHIYEHSDDHENRLVSIILDGENAWECYKNDGRDFLQALYGRLSEDSRFKCVTVSEFFDNNPPRGHIERLFAGSWISHNFRVWIGHDEDNAAWDMLSEARSRLVEKSAELEKERGGKEIIARAWEEVYAAEGSDWFWWFGDDHCSANDADFDALFRKHIKRIYDLLGLEAPTRLDIPIMTAERVIVPSVQPRAYISPVIDGAITDYYEWISSGLISNRSFGSSMHSESYNEVLLDGIRYGFSTEELFLRLDYLEGRDLYEKPWSITINFTGPAHVKVRGKVEGAACGAEVYVQGEKPATWSDAITLEHMASGKVVEMAIPLKTLGAAAGDKITFFMTIDSEDYGPERWPARGLLSIEAPGEEFEEEHWLV
ncbi:MAG: alpha-amylase/alpha-mannosidase [Thermodesulfobacteriota bacterium]